MFLESIEKIKTLAQTVCQQTGCTFYDLEFQTGSRGKGRKLLLYVDKAEGITLDDCERVSKGMTDVLDTETWVPEDYVLEVSSPGLERPLREKWHFEAVVGQDVFVNSKESLVPDTEPVSRHKITGLLKSVLQDEILIESEGQDYQIRIDNIKKAKVVFDFGETKKPKKYKN